MLLASSVCSAVRLASVLGSGPDSRLLDRLSCASCDEELADALGFDGTAPESRLLWSSSRLSRGRYSSPAGMLPLRT